MASFRVSDELVSTGRQASLTWEDGDLRGDFDAEMDVRGLVESGKTVDTTVTGPFHDATMDPADGWWVFRTVCSVSGRGLAVEGKPPGPPPDTSIPPGSVS